MDKVASIEKEYIRKDLPQFSPGDTVKVYFKVKEGDKEKTQSFEGVCIQKKGSGVNQTFTLRKISQGIGVERIFPLHSPLITKIEVKRKGKVRRAKLFYLRKKVRMKVKEARREKLGRKKTVEEV